MWKPLWDNRCVTIPVNVDPSTEHVVFLAGIGQDANAWEPIIAGLPRGFTGHSFAIGDLVDLSAEFTMAAAVKGLHERINRTGDDAVVLCGLSLGAIIATAYAIAYPDRISGLVLSAPQVRPNPGIMLLEKALVTVLPTSMMGLPEGLDKQTLNKILHVVSRIDFRRSLPSITVPTLVVCGTKDRPNLKAARELATALPQARLELIDGGGHELNAERPVEFAHLIADFLSPKS